MLCKPHSALVLAGHGSTVNPDSSLPTHFHADELRRRGCFCEVHCGFWKEDPGLHQVLAMVGSDDIYVVPNFVSEGYFTQTVIPRELGLSGPVTRTGGRVIKYCEPVGNHPRMTEVLLRRAAEVAPGIPAGETSLVVIGHGTSLDENSAAAVNEQVARITALRTYAEVLGAFMEEAPFVADWQRLTHEKHVVFVPFFIADGLHSYQDIPVLIGIESAPGKAASQREVFRLNPYRIGGREVFYASAVGTEPLMADVILDQVEAFDRQMAPAPDHAHTS